MKIMNKLNIAIVGISGVISNPVFAQKFYQCLPVDCKPGEYGAPGACKKCPAGEYTDGVNLEACKPCPANAVCENGVIKLQCEAGKWLYRTCVPGGGGDRYCPGGQHIADKSTVTQCGTCPAGNYCPGDGEKYECSGLSVSPNKGASSCTKIDVTYDVDDKGDVTLTGNGTSLKMLTGGGGCSVVKAWTSDCIVFALYDNKKGEVNKDTGGCVRVCLSDPTPTSLDTCYQYNYKR